MLEVKYPEKEIVITTRNRQQRYRKRRRGAGDVRLDIWVSNDCKNALERVSGVLGVSYWQIVEKLILQVDEVMFATQQQ